MFGKGQTSCILGNAKVANNCFYMSINNKLLMCWKKKMYFKRFYILPAIPPGNSRDEVLSQK